MVNASLTIPHALRAVPNEWLQQQLGTKQCESFVHLHLGIDGAVFPFLSSLSRRVLHTFLSAKTALRNLSVATLHLGALS